MHYMKLYLPSLELTTSSTTQQRNMVVQLVHMKVYLPLLALAASAATLQSEVVPSLHTIIAN